jgi:hypothetical protein
MTALGINLSLNWTYYSSYHTAYYVYFPTISQFLEPYNGGYASRLVPRGNFDKNKKFKLTVEVYRDLAEGGYFMNGYHYAPTLAAGQPVGPDGNAVNPAWGGSYMNEGNILEPYFQQSFYGGGYERLVLNKRKYDPGDLFWAVTAVRREGCGWLAD